MDNTQTPQHKLGCLPILGIMLLTVIISVGVTFWLINYYLFPKRFEPVTLNQRETSALEEKLNQVGLFGLAEKEKAQETLVPEPYTEEGANREISLSEKELNALLAKNTDMAEQLVIDLSDNLASGKLLVPLDPDFPFFGGKTLKVSGGMELAYANERPIVVLKGVSVWGVPIPNAWLGNLKNVDLVGEFGGEEGFWKAFADGVDNIRVEEGHLLIRLKE